jgi:hypothetical protein
MKRLTLTFVLAGFVLVDAALVWAKDDTVYVREGGKNKDILLTGKIEEESPAGIKLKPAKGETKTIPALQIQGVDYGEGVDIIGKVDYRAGDSKLERALAETNPKKRVDELAVALLSYRALVANEKLRPLVPVHRYFQYRLAQTQALQARDDAARRDAALAALNDYKTNFLGGWETVPALQMLASLQVDKGDAEAASQTYSALAEVSGLTPEMKLQSQMQASRLLLRAQKFADAERKLTQVEAALPRDDPQRTFVEVYLMQSRIAQNSKLEGIDKKLDQIIRTNKDDHLLAVAHNALGDYYRAKNEKERAFWEYCKVDVLYDRDKEEHAKALYYLAQLFGEAPRNDRERAEECRTRLKTSAFEGTLYQRLAVAEKK